MTDLYPAATPISIADEETRSPILLTFFSTFTPNEEVARLFINEEGQLAFTGDMDETATMFFNEFVRPLADNYIRHELAGGN